jgi:hypothetical protein
MISNYHQFSSTYHSGKVAQTYLLASKVKSKLTQEAIKNDVNLLRLVCQANLLDNLIENLNFYDSHNHSDTNEHNNFPISYNSINSSTYPLLNNISDDVEQNAINNYDDDNDDDDDDVISVNVNVNSSSYENNNNFHHSDLYYTSDDSDFDSDNDDDDYDDDGYEYNNYNNKDQQLVEKSNVTYTDDANCITSSDDLCCLALQRLNIKSGVEETVDDANIYDTEFSVHHTTIAFSDSESESDDDVDIYVSKSRYLENSTSLMRMHSKNSSLNINHHTEAIKEDNLNDDDFSSLTSCSSVSSNEDSVPIDQLIKFQILHKKSKSSSNACF